MQKNITKNAKETRSLGKKFAKALEGGEILCLQGELGSGKTTFSQGVLEGLGAEKPYTSPTFVVMKSYQVDSGKIKNIYHIDTYRVDADDVLDLGWDEILSNKENVLIVEWPERIKSILPENSMRINFESINEKERSIVF